MSYTTSQSQTGLGTLIQINTGTITTPTWTTIGEITKSNLSGKKNNFDDVTNLQSLAEEFLATISTSGTFHLTYNRVSTNTGQTAVVTAWTGAAKTQFKITLPINTAAGQSSQGDTFVFLAYVEELNDVGQLEPKKAIVSETTLKATGAYTFTEGS